MKKRVLIIGAGERVQSTVLPALYILSDTFQTVGVSSRSIKEVSHAKGLTVETTGNLESYDFLGIDIVIVAVTLDQVPNVLSQIPEYSKKHLTLFLDTPVLAYFHLGYLKELNKFRRVFVSEEHVYLPAIRLAKKLEEAGKIGKVKQITLDHFGYQYHAYAVLKYLSDSPYAALIRRVSSDNGVSKKFFSFPNKIRAALIEPQQYNKGYFEIVGENGVISDGPVAADFRIGFIIRNNIYRGLTLNGKSIDKDKLDSLYLDKIDDCVFEKNLMKSMKIRAFAELLFELFQREDYPWYSPAEAFSDQISMALAERLSVFIDFPFGTSSLFDSLIRLSANLLPSYLVLPSTFSDKK